VAVDPAAATAAKAGPRASRARSTTTSREVNRAASLGGGRLNAMESRQLSPRRTRTQTLRSASVLSPECGRSGARRSRRGDTPSGIWGASFTYPALGENAGPRNCNRLFRGAFFAFSERLDQAIPADGSDGNDAIAVGHLTSTTTLENGGTYAGGGQNLYADVEVAVEIGAAGEISSYGVALEFCNLADGGTSEEVVAKNDYHRAVAFGPFVEELPAQLEAVLFVNGERRSAAPAPTPTEIADRVAAVNRVLEAVGERLRPGDRVITGLIVNGPVSPGDEVVAELVPLGCVQLRVDSGRKISR
jgi:hypothetical protein